MATTFTVSPVLYQGQAVQEYLLKCMRGNATGNAGVRFIDSVKDKIIIKKLDAPLNMEHESCGYNPTGSITSSGLQYSVFGYQDQSEICWKDIPQLFGSENLTAGANNGSIDQVTDFAPALIETKVKTNGESVDNMLWNSVAATGGTITEDFDGFIEILTNSGGNNITGTSASAITTSNALAVFGAVYAAAAENASCVLSKPVAEQAFFVSPKTAALYKLANTLFINVGPLGAIVDKFLDVDIVAIPAIGDDIVIFGERKNFVILTDLWDDSSQVSILDEHEKYNYVVFTMRMKLGAGIGFPAEITTWGLA